MSIKRQTIERLIAISDKLSLSSGACYWLSIFLAVVCTEFMAIFLSVYFYLHQFEGLLSQRFAMGPEYLGSYAPVRRCNLCQRSKAI